MSVSYDRRVVTRDEASFFSTIPHTLHEEQPLLPKVPYSAYIEATTTRRRRLDQEGRRVEEGIISCRPYPSSKARLSHHQKRKQENSNLEDFSEKRKPKEQCLAGWRTGIRHHIRHSPGHIIIIINKQPQPIEPRTRTTLFHQIFLMILS